MVKLLIAGDFCMYNRMQHLYCNEIVASMSSVIPYIEDSDYSILNLECSVFNGNFKPIVKCGANLHNSPESIKAIKKLGFNGVTLANNHFADFGTEAVCETISFLEKLHVDYYGGGRNLREASQIKYIEINNKTIAIINYCEHEYTYATETKGGANPLDLINVYEDIQLSSKNSDYIIVIVHGGSEHYELPTPRMQRWYRFFVDIGADAVINHHQHCYSGYEFYKSKPIVYGLGNFCFDWEGYRQSSWNKGYLLQLYLDQEIRINLIPYVQCDENVGTYIIKDRTKFDVHIGELLRYISDSNIIDKKYNEFIETKLQEYLYIFHHPQNKIIRRIANKGLLSNKLISELCPIPLYKDKNKLLTLLSYFQCESHHDIMTLLLNKLKKEL